MGSQITHPKSGRKVTNNMAGQKVGGPMLNTNNLQNTQPLNFDMIYSNQLSQGSNLMS
jgi:hypothetical protein